MSAKKPEELKVGDVFIARAGPYSGRHVRVLAPAKAGRYGVYLVRAEILNTMYAKVDFNDTVEVLDGV